MFEGDYWRARKLELRKSIIQTVKNHTHGNSQPKGKQITPQQVRRIRQVPLRRRSAGQN